MIRRKMFTFFGGRSLLVLVILFWSRFAFLTTVDTADVDEICDGYSTTIKTVNNITKCSQVIPTEKNDQQLRWRCPSLEAALDLNSTLTDTCIELDHDGEREENLTKVHVLRNSKKVKISSRGSVIIRCRGGNAGIFFVGQGESVEVSNLNFMKCGGMYKSYYRHTHHGDENQKLYGMELTAVLGFEGIERVTMTTIQMNNFRGYGIVMTDCVGVIQLADLTLDSNTPAPCVFENLKDAVFSYGGGFMFRHISERVLNGTFLTVSGNHTKFTNIRGVNFNTAISNLSDFTDLIPFGYGGGISLYFYRSTDNSIALTYPNISGNSAIFGGGFYLYHGTDSTHNIIQLQHLICDSNTAIYSGGCIDYVNENNPYDNNNTFILEAFDSMSRNTALHGYGGAFSYYKKHEGKKQEHIDRSFAKINFKGLAGNFSNNNAKLGSAMFFERAHIRFDGTVVVNNNNDNILSDSSKGFGAVYFFDSHLFIDGSIAFVDNKMTGLVLDSSYIHLKGTLELNGNVGIKGGGMALFENSQIILDDADSYISITNNKAIQGAGMYVYSSGPFDDTWKPYFHPVYECFFRFAVKSDKKRVVFKGNSHSDIFTSSLRRCGDSGDHLSFFVDSMEFDFNKNENPISTDPVRINLPHSDIWNNMYPGVIFTIPVELFDETNHTVSSVVRLSIKNTTTGSKVRLENGDHNLIVVDNKVAFSLLIAQQPNVSFELEFSVDNVIVHPQRRKATFANCPFGLKYKGKSSFNALGGGGGGRFNGRKFNGERFNGGGLTGGGLTGRGLTGGGLTGGGLTGRGLTGGGLTGEV